MRKKYLISIFILFLIIISSLIFFRSIPNKNKEYISNDKVNNLISRVYTYENGYDEVMKDIISEEAFLKVNPYRFYNNLNLKMPISINIDLYKLNQKKVNDIIAVYFEYNQFIYDGNKKEISGELNSPAVAFISQKEDKLYIEDIQIYENINDVPKMYK